jgi:hypothetical protein
MRIAMSWVLSMVCVAACGGHSNESDASIDAVASNRIVSATATGFEAEPSLAADGGGTVVITWMRFPRVGVLQTELGYAVSHDGGATFGVPATIASPVQGLVIDPVVTWTGTAFDVVWGVVPQSGSGHVYMARLDHGDMFATPIDVTPAGGMVDKPWIVAPTVDRELITWADFATSRIGFAVTGDGGSTFVRSSVDSPPTGASDDLAVACADPTGGGSLYVAFIRLTGNTASARLSRSDDGGTSWNEVGDASGSDPVVVEDVGCAVRGNEVWISYASGTAPFGENHFPAGDAVRVAHSSDGGHTFDRVVTASDAIGTTKIQMPQLIDERGSLAVAYYQGAADASASLVIATSGDGGVSWSRNMLPSPGTFALDRTKSTWLGDYFGVTAANGGVYLGYGDNRSGTTHIAFDQI